MKKLLMFLCGIGFAAFPASMRAQPQIVTANVTLVVQNTNVDNHGDPLKPQMVTLNTKSLLKMLAKAENARGIYTNTQFPASAQLVLAADGTLQVDDANGNLLAPVSNVLTISSNMPVFTAKQNPDRSTADAQTSYGYMSLNYSDYIPNLQIVFGPVTNSANGHSYYMLSPGTWWQEEAVAETLGGHLATIRNAAENDWIQTNLLVPNPAMHPWIGLTNQNSVETLWAWVSGEPMTFTNWGPGEPNGIGMPPFAANLFDQTVSQPGTWNDAEKFDPYNGLAEVAGGPANPVIPATSGTFFSIGGYAVTSATVSTVNKKGNYTQTVSARVPNAGGLGGYNTTATDGQGLPIPNAAAYGSFSIGGSETFSTGSSNSGSLGTRVISVTVTLDKVTTATITPTQ